MLNMNITNLYKHNFQFRIPGGFFMDERLF